MSATHTTIKRADHVWARCIFASSTQLASLSLIDAQGLLVHPKLPFQPYRFLRQCCLHLFSHIDSSLSRMKILIYIYIFEHEVDNSADSSTKRRWYTYPSFLSCWHFVGTEMLAHQMSGSYQQSSTPTWDKNKNIDLANRIGVTAMPGVEPELVYR